MPRRRERENSRRVTRRLRSNSLRVSGSAGEASRSSQGVRVVPDEVLPRLRSEARASASARGTRRRRLSLPPQVRREIITHPEDYHPTSPLPRLRPRLQLHPEAERNRQRAGQSSSSSFRRFSSNDDETSSDSASQESVIDLRAVRHIIPARRVHEYFFSDASDEEIFEGFGPEEDEDTGMDRFAEVIVFLESGDFLRSHSAALYAEDLLSDDGEIPDDPFQRELRGSMPEPTMSLHAACVRGNVKELRRWKNWKMGQCGRKVRDDTPMHCAARAGDVGTVEELIQQGASFTQTNAYDNSPLEIAARHGHSSVVKVLLRYGAGGDPDEMDRAYEATKSWSVVQTLRAYDPVDISGGPTNGITRGGLEKNAPWLNQLLFRVVQKGRVTMLKGLLSLGANANCNGILGWTPLQIAARRGHLRCVTALLEYGANVDGRDDFRWTALHYAAREGRHEIAKALIKAGADVHVRCRTGRTPLQIATDETTKEVLQNYRKHQ